MPTFSNGESGASVRNKINSAITAVDNLSAESVPYSDASSGLGADNVKAAIDRLTEVAAATGRFVWNANTSAPSAAEAYPPSSELLRNLHDRMRGCVLNDDLTVNYYLDPTDWSLKANGGASDLTGADGQVMVEIPRFYYREERDGSLYKYFVSTLPLPGYVIHPAFFKDGGPVSVRYYSAYDACVYDASAAGYIGGANLDENIGNVDLGADKLASVKGPVPMVGLERDEFRALAANRGSGWRQLDFTLFSAVQLLFLIEHQTFFSQDVLGDGNVNGSYTGSSSDPNDSPHTPAGAGDGWGSGSTDGSQPSAGAKPGTAYMKYRGIENWFGNCWNFADGVNINVSGGASNGWYVTNNAADFADDTTSNYSLLTQSMPGDGYVTDFATAEWGFIPSATGGSSTTHATDYFYDKNGNTNRVLRVGGSAENGAQAGAFYLGARYGSSLAHRNLGARLAA